MAGAAGDIRNTQVEQRGLRFGSFEAVRNQVVERVLDERLNEIVGCVVGTRSCSFVALCKAELDGVAVVDEYWLVFEQAFVNRPELLHVERGVVHPNKLMVLRVLVDIEGTQAAEEHVIAQRARGKQRDSLIAEEVARQRGDAQLLAWPVGLKEPEG
jgi:hypothetical protein